MDDSLVASEREHLCGELLATLQRLHPGKTASKEFLRASVEAFLLNGACAYARLHGFSLSTDEAEELVDEIIGFLSENT